MGRRRKVEIVITDTRKGSGFKDTKDQVDDLDDHLKRRGKEGGDHFGDEADKSMTAKFQAVGRKLPKILGKGLTVGLKPVAAMAAVGFAAQFAAAVGPSLAGAVKSVGSAGGAGLALLPAAVLAGGLGLATFKVALSGIGDTLSAGLSGDTEAFGAALKGLSPSARDFAQNLVGLRGQLGGLKSAVQESFFAPLTDQVRPLGERYLPMIRSTLSGIATGFGLAGRSITKWAQLPEVSDAIGVALGKAGKAVTNLAAGVPSLVAAFLPLVTVGASFLPGLTAGFDGLTGRVADFMTEAERTGKLREFISNGLSAVGDLVDKGRQLGRILGDVRSVLASAFDATGITAGAGGILDAVERVTSSVAKFFQTSEGSVVMTGAMDAIRVAALALKGPISATFGLLATTLRPLLPKVALFASAFARLAGAVLDVGLEALEPVVRGLGSALGRVLPPLTRFANWLADSKPVIQGVAIAIGALLVPAFVSWAAAAATAAASTLLAMLPIVLFGAAVAGLAALVIINFDKIKRAVETALTWVRTNWPLLLAILTGPIGLAVLAIVKNWQAIRDGATAAKNWVAARFGDLVSIVTGLPGRIGRAASGMFGGITGAFKSAINTVIMLWNGLRFPALTVGGQDPLGSFGPSLPRVTIGGWDLPNIEPLGDGGIVKARPGGVFKRLAERGRDEAAIPLPRDWKTNGLGGGGDTVVNVTVNVGGLLGMSANDLERQLVATINRAQSRGATLKTRRR